MADACEGLRIRTAGSGDLESLYHLAAAALSFDRFSSGLLAEKLFRSPRPASEQYTVLLAESAGRPVGFMQTVARPAAHRAWLGLFAVEEASRRRGVATALHAAALRRWSDGGAESVDLLGIPGNYLAPGLDPRYTAALCWLWRMGYERFGDTSNLVADIREAAPLAEREAQLASGGFEIRRAVHADGARLSAFFEGDFGADWHLETSLAMQLDPPGVHVALRDGRIVAFASHSSQNREWGFFGPMGTIPAVRGHGLGAVLLMRCLADLRQAGHECAVIPWVGPIAFYAALVPCRVERVYWRLRKAITKPSMPPT